MYCRFCGKEIRDDSTFCQYCGKSLRDDSVDSLERDTLSSPRLTKNALSEKAKRSFAKELRLIFKYLLIGCGLVLLTSIILANIENPGKFNSGIFALFVLLLPLLVHYIASIIKWVKKYSDPVNDDSQPCNHSEISETESKNNVDKDTVNTTSPIDYYNLPENNDPI